VTVTETRSLHTIEPIWLREPQGQAHCQHHRSPTRSRCGQDLSGAVATTVLACEVYCIPLCTTCFRTTSTNPRT